jgi:hypothetical protein
MLYLLAGGAGTSGMSLFRGLDSQTYEEDDYGGKRT